MIARSVAGSRGGGKPDLATTGGAVRWIDTP